MSSIVASKIFSIQLDTTENCSSLFQSLNEILVPAYDGAMFPSDDLLYKSLFNDQTIVTEEVKAMITHSVYTLNALCTEVASQFKKTIDRKLQQLQ